MKFFSFAATALLAGFTFAKTGPATVVYVEVNNNNLSNVARYSLTDGSPVFDIGIIFAANINYNGQKAVLYNNPQVTSTLNNAASQIKPLQAKGIKVLLSILGNHQGAGIANFQSYAAALDFAKQVAAVIQQYGLDGVDLDDEYADYGNNNLPQPNDNSIAWLLQALRAQLGTSKLITFYYIGPAADSLSRSNSSIGGILNYSWNPYYGTYQAPSIPGLGKSKLAAAAIQYGSTSQSTAVSFAKSTKTDGYGVYLTYALDAVNRSTYVSAFTQVLYGQKAIFK